MELADLKKGQHVFLTLKSTNVYEGDVGAINVELKRIRLENITTHPENVKLESDRKFDFDEVVSFKTFEPKSVPENLTDLDAAQEPTTIKISQEDYNAIVELQKNYRYIKAYDTNFHSAIAVIEKNDKIGFTMMDCSRGRKHRGSVIGISTPDQIFLFDVEVMGDGVFDKGLRNILESESIFKIVHDCRLLSDCLREKHLVDIKNVLDVEAEDIFLLYRDQNRLRKHSRSLNYLIEYYLGVPVGFTPKKLNELWKRRPLEDECQNALASYVAYLIPLQKEIESVQMKKFIAMSNLFNNLWKNFHSTTDDFALYEHLRYTPREKIREFLKIRAPLRGRKKKSSSSDVEEDEASKENIEIEK